MMEGLKGIRMTETTMKGMRLNTKCVSIIIMSLVLSITAGTTLINPVQAYSFQDGKTDEKIEGIWKGSLRFSGMELRLVFTISRKADSTLVATYDVPEQNVKEAPVDKITFADREVRLEIIPIDGVFQGKLSADGEKIEGHWAQSGMELPLVLERTQEKPEIRRPQEPKEPFPYKVEEVVYENAEASIRLAGTLTLPSSEGAFPAVLLLSGSGAQDRDETVFSHRPFLVLADHLTRKGIAVLRTDDRGVGGSSGKFDEATAADYAADALSGVAYLKGRKEIHHESIGLIGHSEGGIIASMVAAQSPDIAFIVLIASPGLPIKKMESLGRTNTLKAKGAGEDLITRSLALQENLFDVIRQKTDGKTVRDEFTSIITEYFKGLSGEEKKIAEISEENLDTYIQNQFQRLHSPWFRFYLPFDPGTVLQKVTCPVLAVNGEKDVQVTSKNNLQAIKKALKAGGNTNFTVKELPNLNHLLQSAETGALSEYAKIEETMSPVALQLISSWILIQFQ